MGDAADTAVTGGAGAWSAAHRARLAAELAAFSALGPPRDGVAHTVAHDGQDHDEHVVFGVMVHGEECGALAGALALLGELARGERRFGGRLTVFVGNPPAGLEGRRFREADLNRVFLDLPAGHPLADSWEARRATDLRRVLDTTALFVDFHQTIEPTAAPFVISPWTPGIEAWVRRVQPAPAWVTRAPDASFSAGTCCADEYVRGRGGVAWTLELSQRGFSAAAADRAHRVMAGVLAAVDAAAAGQPLALQPAGPLPTCYETAVKVAFDDPALRLRPGLQNFAPVSAGAPLHPAGSVPVSAPQDGVLLFPKYPPRDAHGRALEPRPGELVRILAPLTVPPAVRYARPS